MNKLGLTCKTYLARKAPVEDVGACIGGFIPKENKIAPAFAWVGFANSFKNVGFSKKIQVSIKHYGPSKNHSNQFHSQFL